MAFIDRELELRYLNQAYKAASAQLVILYGRRRVGKTALLREFTRSRPAIYYLATRLPEALQLKLEPFPFREARKFLPRYGAEDQIRTFAILGGIPYYISRFDDGVPVLENVRDQVFARGAILREEVEFLLREELQEPRVYFAILKALSQGKRKPSEIASATGLVHGTLSKYLAVRHGEIDFDEKPRLLTVIARGRRAAGGSSSTGETPRRYRPLFRWSSANPASVA